MWSSSNPSLSRGNFIAFLYLETRQHIHLLLLLDKNEQEDLTTEQRKQIRQWAAQVKRDSGE
jgi:hypothetical protein